MYGCSDVGSSFPGVESGVEDVTGVEEGELGFLLRTKGRVESVSRSKEELRRKEIERGVKPMKPTRGLSRASRCRSIQRAHVLERSSSR